jgi:hypothetical protein
VLSALSLESSHNLGAHSHDLGAQPMDLKVSPAAEDTPEAKAPLLDLEAIERRVRTLETTPAQQTIDATLNVIATREPTSFHQATIYFGLRDDTPPRRKYGFLAISVGIVFLQCFVATGFAVATVYSSCSVNSECGRGQFCAWGNCEDCHNELENCCQTNSTECYSNEVEKVKEDMCSACMTDRGFETLENVRKDRVNSMMAQDWITLTLASIVVAFAVFGEIRDAMLCGVTLRDIAKRRKVPCGWRLSFGALNHMRLFVFLPNIVLSIVGLILAEGGNIKEICLNTVAVLFLVEIDNLSFLFGLGEESRMEAEQHCRVSVGARDLRSIDVVKAVCLITIPLTILALVNSTSYWTSVLYAPMPMLLIAVVQSLEASRYTFKGACLGLFRALTGYVLAFGFFTFVVVLSYWY